MYHVIAVTKLKIVNWWPKRPKSKTFTKLFGLLGTENLMNGSKMWRLFTLKEHKYKIFPSDVPIFLNKYIEFEHEILIFPNIFKSVFYETAW